MTAFFSLLALTSFYISFFFFSQVMIKRIKWNDDLGWALVHRSLIKIDHGEFLRVILEELIKDYWQNFGWLPKLLLIAHEIERIHWIYRNSNNILHLLWGMEIFYSFSLTRFKVNKKFCTIIHRIVNFCLQ